MKLLENEIILYFGGAILLCLLLYLFTEYKKASRINALKRLGFKVERKINKLHRKRLMGLAPEFMEPPELPLGTVALGDNPSVWWHAKYVKSEQEISIWKVSMIDCSGSHAADIEWIVFMCLPSKDNQSIFQQRSMPRFDITPEKYYENEKGIYWVFRDSFLSIKNIVSICESLYAVVFGGDQNVSA